jgi:hypothetical protein
MKSMEEKPKVESLSELERIEGNYYKVDLFVGSALVLFTLWVIFSEKSTGWAVLLGVMALLFLLRGMVNWRAKVSGKKPEQRV